MPGAAADAEFAAGVTKPPVPKDDEEALQKLVEGNDDLKFKEDFPKVVVLSTGHELPMKLFAVQEYLKSTSYLKGKSKWYAFDYSQFEPTLVQHASLKKHLHCKITGTVLPKDPEKVKRHMESRRVKEALAEKENAAKKRAEIMETRKKLRQAMLLKKKSRDAASSAKAGSRDGGEAAADKPPKADAEKKRRKDGKDAKAKQARRKASAKDKAKKAVAGGEGAAEAKGGDAQVKLAGKTKKTVPLRALKRRRKGQEDDPVASKAAA